MNGLDGMIRLSTWQLDEARKALTAAESELAAILHAIDRIDRELAAERDAAGQSTDVMTSAAFGPYANAMMRRRAALSGARSKAEATREKTREAMSAAFMELKKYEILAARREEQRKIEDKRREQKALDEISTQLYREN